MSRLKPRPTKTVCFQTSLEMSATAAAAKPVADGKRRCGWPRSELMLRYHDEEWGVPLRDDRKLFEFLVLDAAQAGLSWEIILRKREGYRAAFDNFDAEKVARYDARRVQRLLADPGIIRNRLKIASAITNARAFLQVREECGSFASYIWQFVGGRPLVNHRRSLKAVPARTKESDAMSKALRARGFRFVGSTICYAFMQAAGMVNDHTVGCFRHAPLARKMRGWRIGGS
jgi:DNA-3-methyladenine glycosylase I